MGNGAEEQQHAGSAVKGKDLDQTGSGASNGGGVFALTTRVYRRRWVMLILFSTFSMSNAFQWIQFGSISNIIAKFYGVEMSAVNWLSIIYMVSYIVLIVPATWLLEKRGLRIALLLANMLNCAGAWIKVASARPDLYWVTVLGQFLSATSQVLFLGIPPKLAAVWFGPHEVSVACSIGVLGNQLGIAIGFLVPPILVHNVDDLDELGYHIRVMFYITAGFTTVMFILVIIVFQDKPEIPPSQAQVQAKHFLSVGSSYAASLLRLLRNRPFMLLVLSYGINVGSLYAISTLLNRMIIGSYPGQEENAGRIGLTLILSGILGAFLCGIWLDRTKLFKQTLFAMYILTLIGMLVFTFTLSLGHLWLVFITVGTLGFFMSGYLPLGFEYGIELTYPEAEGTSSGMLNVLAQIFGIIFTICDEKVIDKWGTLAGNIFLTCFLLIGTIITGLIKSDLRRQQANVENCLSTPTGSESLAQDYGTTGWSGTWQ